MDTATVIRPKRFFLYSLIPRGKRKEDMIDELEELKSLVETYGGEVHAAAVQRNEYYDKHTYIGTGKAQELVDTIHDEQIDCVVINDIVRVGQLFTLEKIFIRGNEKIKVWDRIDLILQIFSMHASTTEAKLQIELAGMRHMGPRIFGMGMELSNQAGGIGTRGIGETNTELMKRHWKIQMKQIRDKIDKLNQTHELQLERRKRQGLQTLSIVGYTNAGKTTLYNHLSGKKKLAKNVLFATLDSTVGKLYLPNAKKEILISDTIGFIKNLPHTLIDAFKSTLMESVAADVLLHVIDTADPHMHEKIAVVEKILRELQIENHERIYVFNKIDTINNLNKEELSRRYSPYSPHFISVQTGEGMEDLMHTIEQRFLFAEK